MKTKTKDNKKKAVPATGRDAARPGNATGFSDLPSNEEPEDPDTINLPDVEDIPGQEYVKPPTLESFVDATASSADEEGPVRRKKDPGGDANDDAQTVFREEDEGLMNSTDSEDYNLRRAALDDTDDDGEPLNEEGFGGDLSGKDLDVPGAEADDDNEEIGEEDEENNTWSLEGEREDNEASKHE